jgi:hypothetical protein
MKRYFIFLLTILVTISYAQTLTQEEKALENWLPANIGEYELDGLPMTVTSKSSEKPYSMSSKNYKKGTSVLAIIIFDYKDNPALLKKYTSSWISSAEDESKRSSSKLTVDELPAWESVDKKANTAQLYVNIKDRYLLFLSVTGNSPEFLRSAAKNLKLRELPL